MPEDVGEQQEERRLAVRGIVACLEVHDLDAAKASCRRSAAAPWAAIRPQRV
jgi:hypothetical protein